MPGPAVRVSISSCSIPCGWYMPVLCHCCHHDPLVRLLRSSRGRPYAERRMAAIARANADWGPGRTTRRVITQAQQANTGLSLADVKHCDRRATGVRLAAGSKGCG